MEPTSARKATWVFVLLFFGLLVFIFVPLPFRKAPPSPPSKPAPVESRLRAVGLSDYADWQNLPGEFAVWADHAVWKDDKTQFAYWNPGTRSYSYFFEATRTPGAYHFKEIPKPKEFRLRYPDDAEPSDEHPFRFGEPTAVEQRASPPPSRPSDGQSSRTITVPVDISPTKLAPEPLSPKK